jgi:hypothetical protein
MTNKPDRIEYRGWRLRVGTPLGFFTFALVFSAPVLYKLALDAPQFQGLIVGALVVLILGLPLLVAYLSIRASTPLDGIRPVVRKRRGPSRRAEKQHPAAITKG